MNDSPEAIGEPSLGGPDSRRAPSMSKPYLRYGFILAALALIRVFEAATSGAYFRVEFYESQSAWIAISLLASVVCYAAASILRRFYPPTITILMSVVVGATTTLIVSTIPGMVVGLFAGAIATFDVSRRVLVLVLKAALWLGLPATVLGGISGYVGGMFLVRADSPIGVARKSIWVFVYLVVIGIVWTYWVGRKERRNHGFTASGFVTDVVAFLAFLAVAGSAFIGGIQADTARRIRVGGIASWSQVRVPLGYENLVRGLFEPSVITLQNGLSEEQGRLLSPLGSFSMLWVGFHSPGNDTAQDHDFSGLRHLQLGSVSRVYASTSAVGLKDEDLVPLDGCPMLMEVILPLSQITDDGVKLLTSNASVLSHLDLRGGRVTGAGIAHVHPTAPLGVVELSGCPVSDDVFANLSGPGRVVSGLGLAGTKVTGAGLAGVTLPALKSLNVANSRFDERNLRFIPPPVIRLDLSGIRITAIGATALSKLRPAFLTLIGTGIEDETVALLGKCLSGCELVIDASLLTTSSAEVLSRPSRLELVFEASGRELDDVLRQVHAMRDAIYRELGWDGETPGFVPPQDLKLTINQLDVTKSLLPVLLESGVQLSNPKIWTTGGDAPIAIDRIDRETRLYELGANRGTLFDAHEIQSMYAMEEQLKAKE